MFASWRTKLSTINSPIHSFRLPSSSCILPLPSSDTTLLVPHLRSSCLPTLMTLSTFVLPCSFLGSNGVDAYLQPGDIVAVNNGVAGRREGLVVGSHIDHLVRDNVLLRTNLSQPTRLLRVVKSSRFSWTLKSSTTGKFAYSLDEAHES